MEYLNTLLYYVERNVISCYGDFSSCYEIIEHIENEITDLISTKRDYLLTEDYLCYIAVSVQNDLSLCFKEALDHLKRLNNDNLYIQELHDYYTFIFDTLDSRYEFKITHMIESSLNSNPITKNNIQYIKQVLKNIGKPESFYVYSKYNGYYDVIKAILVSILCYATINRRDFIDYYGYIDRIINNLDAFLDRLELNAICEKVLLKEKVDSIDINKLLEFLGYYLNDGNINNDHNKTII